MSERKKGYNSLQEFAEAFFKENPGVETQNLLLYYGIDIPIEELGNIEIIEKSRGAIIFYNKKTKQFITSNLLGRVLDKFDVEQSVSLTTSNNDKTFFVEYFNEIDYSKTYKEVGKNALKARNNHENLILSRAYADINTKYGNFCLHIEEGFNKCKDGSYRQVSLYYGNHEQVIIYYKNDFDFNKFCLFRWKYLDSNNFSQWIMGDGCRYDHPTRNIWNYGSNTVISPIYSCQDYEKYSSMAIFKNGSLKIVNNFKYIPDIFNFSKIKELLKEYENLECTSKVYCTSYGKCLVTIKQKSTITIEYYEYKNQLGKWDKIISTTTESTTDKEFIFDDFKSIIKTVETLSINEEFEHFVIRELKTYINIHNKNEFDVIDKFTLEQVDFDMMLQYIESHDLTKLVEEWLERISQNFNMNIDELLGKNVQNQTNYQKNLQRNIRFNCQK